MRRCWSSVTRVGAAASSCSLDAETLPNLPREILVIFDFSLLFFFLALSDELTAAAAALFELKSPALLNVLSSTILERDLFIKSSANDTRLGLGSRLIDDVRT